MSPESVKAKIRARTKPWFDAKNGARGWIAGPFICLWWTALNPYGPMLIGWIAQEGTGTRITGRAGHDLNGTIVLVLAGIAAGPIGWSLVLMGQASLTGVLLFSGFYGALVVLVLWTRSFYHREAGPLFRFLQNAVTPKARRTKPGHAVVTA